MCVCLLLQDLYKAVCVGGYWRTCATRDDERVCLLLQYLLQSCSREHAPPPREQLGDEPCLLCVFITAVPITKLFTVSSCVRSVFLWVFHCFFCSHVHLPMSTEEPGGLGASADSADSAGAGVKREHAGGADEPQAAAKRPKQEPKKEKEEEAVPGHRKFLLSGIKGITQEALQGQIDRLGIPYAKIWKARNKDTGICWLKDKESFLKVWARPNPLPPRACAPFRGGRR